MLFLCRDYVPSFKREWEVVLPLDDVRTLQVDPASIQVRKRTSFAPFCIKSDHFTKTGSGQTQGKPKTRGAFPHRAWTTTRS